MSAGSRPAAPARLAGLAARVPAAWRTPLAAWAASRALVMAMAVVGSLVLGVPTRGVDPSVPDPLALLGGWDTSWYLQIARDGYAHDLGQVGEVFTNLAFFPLLPAVMAGALALALNPFWVALVVTNLAFLAALAGAHAIARSRFDERRATYATWSLALLPTALAASQAYTEGLILALAVAAALAALRGRLWLAGLAAALAALSRPSGLTVALLAGMIAWQGAPAGAQLARRALRAAAVVAPAVAAVVGFLIWMQVARGSWDLPLRAQEAWARGGPVTGLFTALPDELAAGWEYLTTPHFNAAWAAVARDLSFGVLYVVLLVMLWRREGGLRSPWVVYSAAVLAVPLSSGSIVSLGRFGLAAFPLAWPLGDWIAADRRRVVPAVVLAVVVTGLLVAQLAIRSP